MLRNAILIYYITQLGEAEASSLHLPRISPLILALLATTHAALLTPPRLPESVLIRTACATCRLMEHISSAFAGDKGRSPQGLLPIHK